MVLDRKVGFYPAVGKDGPARPHQDAGFFRVEDIEKAGAQSRGIEAGRQEMDSVLNGKEMVGVLIDSALEGTPLERQYLVGFWKGVARAIKEKMNPALDENEYWNNIVQTIEGRVRDAERDPEGEKIKMIDVTEKINDLVRAASDDTVRLAA